MDAELAEQIRTSLIEKRTHVKEWLEKTEPSEKQLQLGPADEQAVQAHLEVLTDRSKKPTRVNWVFVSSAMARSKPDCWRWITRRRFAWKTFQTKKESAGARAGAGPNRPAIAFATGASGYALFGAGRLQQAGPDGRRRLF